MTDDKDVSPYLQRPLRDLCPCGRGPVKAELEVCEDCEMDAQADVNVIEVDFEKVVRIFSGDDR